MTSGIVSGHEFIFTGSWKGNHTIHIFFYKDKTINLYKKIQGLYKNNLLELRYYSNNQILMFVAEDGYYNQLKLIISQNSNYEDSESSNEEKNN